MTAVLAARKRAPTATRGTTEPCINLTFHGVGEPDKRLDRGERAVWLSRERFESVLDTVTARSAVRITFDDGNRSDITLALPALRARGLHATFFVVAGRLGTPGYLDAEDLQELGRAGMTIGSHGMGHVAWRGLDEPALHAELVLARTGLERTAGTPILDASCPFGAYDRRVLRALRSAGYERVWTSDGGMADPAAWLQARNTVGVGAAADVCAAIEQQAALRRARRAVVLAVKRWR